MLVAFLYDLKVREESAGKITLADRYRDLFNGGVTEHAQGNEAIINVLGSSPALKGFAKAYIENSSDLDLEQALPVYGLQLDTNGKSSQLRVGRDLDTNQKRLLRSLGYRG
jgi:predicted metalloprotease with PDZ domain